MLVGRRGKKYEKEQWLSPLVAQNNEVYVSLCQNLSPVKWDW